MNENDPRRERRRRAGRPPRHLAMAVAVALHVGVLGGPAAAATTTTNPPYSGSNSYQVCDDMTISCRAVAFADHSAGRLAVDLSVIGSEGMQETGACGQMYTFPPDPFCGGLPVGGTGARGAAWLWADGVARGGVSAVVFTVTIRTGAATASGGSASAILSAGAFHPGGCGCTGATQQTVVSPLAPSAPAGTRTLQFTYRAYSGLLPSGPIGVYVDLAGDVRGPGLNEVRVSGTVTAITATTQP